MLRIHTHLYTLYTLHIYTFKLTRTHLCMTNLQTYRNRHLHIFHSYKQNEQIHSLYKCICNKSKGYIRQLIIKVVEHNIGI